MFYFIGLLFCLVTAARLFYFIYRKFIRAPLDLSQRYGGDGSWAVITGASDGIGKGFCFSLAKRGFNVCLIGRNQQKLDQVMAELKEKSPDVKYSVVIADFSKGPANPVSFYENLYDEILTQGVTNISILVNNAGFVESNLLEKLPLENIAEIIAVNIYPVSFLCKLLLPKMAARNKRSLVINLSSVTGTFPVPFSGFYGGSKAYNLILSESLGIEFKNRVDFLTLKPNYVSTKATKLTPGGSVITVEQCVESCLKDAGYDTRTAGHWKHDILEWFYVNVAPQKVVLKARLKSIQAKEKQKQKTS